VVRPALWCVQAWLHRHIGLVSQEPVLFATSIRANLTYGVEQATDDDIKRACEMANAHEFISGMFCVLPSSTLITC
jgi:ABC-type multidrug transport system fused ATPase/permease subunit